jgi:hypothetical protein
MLLFNLSKELLTCAVGKALIGELQPKELGWSR